MARQYNLIPPSMEQPQYNLFHRKRVEVDLIPALPRNGLGLTTWSPLYYGILTGKYNDGIPEGSRASLDRHGLDPRPHHPRADRHRAPAEPVAEDLDVTTAQLAIAWLLRRKEVSSVITGATRIEQLDENLAAADVQEHLTDDLLERIDQICGHEE